VNWFTRDGLNGPRHDKAGRVEGHPRPDFKSAVKKDVDARPKAGHDEQELF
jgi:hypothetical protein